MAATGEQDGELHLDQTFLKLKLQAADPDASPPDICPVCRSSRYLNQSMRFLVNPECYHKMCESCVDRIFSHGPHRCPIAGCTRTLRRHRFREQTFGDIQVEREVDIRKRIAAVFNRREDEFQTLRDYNDYLNNVEDITFNLTEGIDVEETEAKLKAYQAEHASKITQNAAAARRDHESFAARQVAERERTRLARQAARQNDADDRRARLEGQQAVIAQLAAHDTGDLDAAAIAQQGQRIAAKRRAEVRDAAAVATAANGSGFVIKGLKTAGDGSAGADEAQFDPFGGLEVQHRYYALQDEYSWDWLDKVKRDPVILAGGYRAVEFQARALCDAFSGLGVVIGSEAAPKSEVVMAEA